MSRDGDTIESDDAGDSDEELDNFLGDYYPEMEIDDTYENSGTQDYRYSELVIFLNQYPIRYIVTFTRLLTVSLNSNRILNRV